MIKKLIDKIGYWLFRKYIDKHVRSLYLVKIITKEMELYMNTEDYYKKEMADSMARKLIDYNAIDISILPDTDIGGKVVRGKLEYLIPRSRLK